MKKILAMLLVICVGFALGAASAEEDVLGAWYLKKMVGDMDGEMTEIDVTMFGIEMTLVLNADGTGEMAYDGETTPFTWTGAGGVYTASVEDEDGEAVESPFTVSGGVLSMEDPESGTMVFDREPVEKQPVPEPVAAGGEEEFFGTWKATRMDADGTIVPVDALAASGMGVECDLSVEAGLAKLELRVMGPDLPVEGKTEFADGKLTVDALVPFEVQLTDTGELFAVLNLGEDLGMEFPLYFERAE